MKHRILLLVLAVFAVLMTTFLISCDPSADVNVTDSNEENISHEVADESESESETESNLLDYISDVNNEIDVEYAELPPEIIEAMKNDPGRVVIGYDMATGKITYTLLEYNNVADMAVEDDDEPSLLDYISDINFE